MILSDSLWHTGTTHSVVMMIRCSKYRRYGRVFQNPSDVADFINSAAVDETLTVVPCFRLYLCSFLLCI